MKRFTSRKISHKQADVLIEKYYEGLTTGDEEKKLHQFLSQPSLPQKYYAEQAMFGYFKAKNTIKKRHFPLYLRWVAVLAIVFSTVYTIQNQLQPKSYAIINGKKTTNTDQIKAITLHSISEISSTNSAIEEGLKAINTTNLIDEQLDVFNNL